MGGKSTLNNGAILSNGNKAHESSFDLKSWQGLTEVLRVAKGALKDPHDYADFRNLVLEYAQKGGDEEVHKKIRTIIRSFTHTESENIPKKAEVETVVEEQTNESLIRDKKAEEKNVVIQEEKQTTKKRHDAIDRRPTPSFLPKIIPTDEDVNDEEVVLEEPEHVEELGVIEESLLEDVKESDVQTLKPLSMEEVTHQLQNTISPSVQDEPKERVVGGEMKSMQSESQPPVAETFNQSVPPQAPETSSKTMDEHKARISEIKRIVHDRMGNPVALIDTHNELGKQYMVALLNALKATSPGSSMSIENSMRVLEDAYQSLLADVSVVAEPEKAKIFETPEVLKAEKPEEPEIPQTSEVEVNSTPKEPEKIIETKKVERIDTPAISESEEVPEKISVLEIPRPLIKEEKVIPEDSMPHRSPADVIASLRVEKQSNPTQTTETPMKVEKPFIPTPALQTPTKPQSPGIVTETPQPNRTPSQVVEEIPQAPSQSVAKKVPLDIPKKVTQNETAPERTINQSELSKPEVTQALDSLLHEWSLFSGSGLLGMGPGGSEHPLYRKLCRLSMGEVLAGRWEKSDAKVIKVIKQYVDAWRHEQGIAYTINETFEHYLRRVVVRILKRQDS